jgi:nucleotide-binding universal stress UspA family protein
VRSCPCISRSCSRAVLDGMSVLSQARHIEIVTFIGEKEITRGRPDDLKAHFTRHGLTMEYHELTFPAGGQQIAEALQNHAVDRGAGMLIMGGYGHSRLREFILGGATRGVLDDLRMPVFLSH